MIEIIVVEDENCDILGFECADCHASWSKHEDIEHYADCLYVDEDLYISGKKER